MSSSDIAVQARGVSKSYRIAHEQRATTLGESVVRRLKNPIAKVEKETFWALRDVDFDIRQGDVVGIIGRNGAGKSTLLKILSRITAPTTGEIRIKGRVGSLLEVGTGFHPELTGRENIYLNGSILGMSRKEIEARFDEIVDFSGVEQFLDTPVKRFSSGMYVRLAFAVAAHLDPEVMIVDEVLAVGDAEFQKKCLGKLKDVANSGRTILFVSHNMQTVSQLCTKTLFLRSGHLEFVGDTEQAIAKYVEVQDELPTSENADTRPGSGEYRIVSVRMKKRTWNSGEPISANFKIEHRRNHSPYFHCTYHIRDELGIVIIHGDSRLQHFGVQHATEQEVSLEVDGVNLKPGAYTLDLMLHISGYIDVFEGAARFEISPILPKHLAESDYGYQIGQVIAESRWSQLSKEST
jgi:lipopolysaccharide transport system ATP-binding protein